MCEKRGILLCACGAVPKVEWMLRSHGVAYEYEKEIQVKNDMLSNGDPRRKHGKLILFLTIFEVRLGLDWNFYLYFPPSPI